MNGLDQHGLHAPNVPFDQYIRAIGDRHPGSDALWYRMGLARARWVKLLQTDHTPQDARDAVAGGIKVLVRVKGEGTVYHQDVTRAIQDYGGIATVLEIGNEPDLNELWAHAWYIEKVLSECKAAAQAAKLKLCIGGWRMPTPQHPVTPPDSGSTLDKRLRELYKQFDLIGIHAYDPYDLTVPYVRDHVWRWMQTFPGKEYALTEYGIAAKALSQQEKARRYATFVRSLPPSVLAAFAFILGGTSDFASFQGGGYDPNGENSYWLNDQAWETLGAVLGE